MKIVDRGRGPQLSTSRITVQDLFPYLEGDFTHAQILEIMPTLSLDEVEAVVRYIADHRDAVVEQDRRIRERAAARRLPAPVEQAERDARRQRLDRAR